MKKTQETPRKKDNTKQAVLHMAFEPINGMIIKNRFVRSATWEGMAKDDGTCTKRLIDLMGKLAKGGVGYLLSQFLSPAFNKRQDQYGGSIENRVNILIEILSNIRARVGNNYPVLLKMNSRDFLEGGLELDDSLKAGVILKNAGIDAIELSGGTIASGKEGPVRTGIVSGKNEAYFKDAAFAFKEKIDLPIMLVGGIRSFSLAQQLVNDNITDYISMSRPFIREPDLIKRRKAGNHNQAACLSDSKCFIPAMNGKGIYCVVEKKKSRKK